MPQSSSSQPTVSRSALSLLPNDLAIVGTERFGADGFADLLENTAFYHLDVLGFPVTVAWPKTNDKTILAALKMEQDRDLYHFVVI